MRLRKDVNIYLYRPSASLFQVVVELKNVPGALRDFLGVLQDLNINVLGSSSSVDLSAKKGVWSGFVEDSHHTASELKQRISSSRYVLDSIVVGSKEGRLVDGVHFPLTFNTGDKAVMMRAEYVSRMLAAVRERFGTGGDAMLYEEGLGYGRDVGSDYASTLGVGFVRSNLKDALELYQALGWFKLEGVDQDGGGDAVTLRTSGNFECEGRTSAKPNSHFVRGHLCGMLSAFLGAEMACEETKCVAAGDQLCEFALSPIAIVGPAVAAARASAR